MDLFSPARSRQHAGRELYSRTTFHRANVAAFTSAPVIEMPRWTTSFRRSTRLACCSGPVRRCALKLRRFPPVAVCCLRSCWRYVLLVVCRAVRIRRRVAYCRCAERGSVVDPGHAFAMDGS